VLQIAMFSFVLSAAAAGGYGAVIVLGAGLGHLTITFLFCGLTLMFLYPYRADDDRAGTWSWWRSMAIGSLLMGSFQWVGSQIMGMPTVSPNDMGVALETVVGYMIQPLASILAFGCAVGSVVVPLLAWWRVGTDRRRQEGA